jgi:hypothetical protein
VQGSRIAASPVGGDRRNQPDRSAVALPATHDIVSGLINSVFIIVLTVSYAVLIFSGSLAALAAGIAADPSFVNGARCFSD